MRGPRFVRRDDCAIAAAKPMWDALQRLHVLTLYNPPRIANKRSFCFAQNDAWVHPRVREGVLVYGTQRAPNRAVRRAQ